MGYTFPIKWHYHRLQFTPTQKIQQFYPNKFNLKIRNITVYYRLIIGKFIIKNIFLCL